MRSIFRHRSGGFSLVELMVSVVIGLLALLFATRLVVSGETSKDAALGGSDAMQNGLVALFSLSNDGGMAGWGLNDPILNGCDTTFSDTRGYQLLAAKRDGVEVHPLAPVVIQDNGANPDVISFNSGTSSSGVGSLRLTAPYLNENYVVGAERSPYGYNPGDVLVVAAEDTDLQYATPCTLIQTAGFDLSGGGKDARMLIQTGSQYRYNPVPGMAQAYDASTTFVFNLGRPDQLHFHTWSVQNGILRLRATDLAGAETAGASVIDNVVSIKAQYGFETRFPMAGRGYNPNPAGNSSAANATTNGMQVSIWSASMIDADGDGRVGAAGDYQRIAAVRLAVVARSKTAEKPDSSGACSATTVQPTVFATAVPRGAKQASVQVNVAVAGDTLSWQCYRYRVFETIVPFLNSQYRP